MRNFRKMARLLGLAAVMLLSSFSFAHADRGRHRGPSHRVERRDYNKRWVKPAPRHRKSWNRSYRSNRRWSNSNRRHKYYKWNNGRRTRPNQQWNNRPRRYDWR